MFSLLTWRTAYLDGVKVENASKVLNNYFTSSFCHHLNLVRGTNAFQNNIKVESLKLMRQYNISLATKQTPPKDLTMV
jgi:hypothetical protein